MCSQDHSGLVSAVQNSEGPLVGGCFKTKLMFLLIRAKVSVLYREVGHLWEGLLESLTVNA